MDTQTSSNSTTSRGKKKSSNKVAASKAQRAVKKVESNFDSGVNGLVENGGEQFVEIAREAKGFVKRNPKTSIGIALGTGLFVGALVDGRIVQAASIGVTRLIKMAKKRLR